MTAVTARRATAVTAAPAGPLRSRLRASDLIGVGTLGLRARPTRSVLSGLGIAIGIASIVAVVGVTRSSQAQLLSQIGRLGTNLLTVTTGQSLNGQETELPATAAPMIRQGSNVESVAPTALLPSSYVYRSDRVPSGQTGGLSVRACDASLLTTLDGALAKGWFLQAGPYPTTVLGYEAARTLGVRDVGLTSRVWLGGHWYTVTGILQPLQLAPEVNRSALISFSSAGRQLGYDGHPSRIYLRAQPDHVRDVLELLAPTANPAHPDQVGVSRPSDALTAQLAVKAASRSLLLGLGAIALLVGAIGIANVMVISVLERRTEIGLRRALGATRRHVAAQFLTEALVLSTLGGLAGVMIGAAVTAGLALNQGWTVQLPAIALWGGLAVAVGAGALAGLYPALRAARLIPTVALRGI